MVIFPDSHATQDKVQIGATDYRVKSVNGPNGEQTFYLVDEGPNPDLQYLVNLDTMTVEIGAQTFRVIGDIQSKDNDRFMLVEIPSAGAAPVLSEPFRYDVVNPVAGDGRVIDLSGTLYEILADNFGGFYVSNGQAIYEAKRLEEVVEVDSGVDRTHVVNISGTLHYLYQSDRSIYYLTEVSSRPITYNEVQIVGQWQLVAEPESRVTFDKALFTGDSTTGTVTLFDGVTYRMVIDPNTQELTLVEDYEVAVVLSPTTIVVGGVHYEIVDNGDSTITLKSELAAYQSEVVGGIIAVEDRWFTITNDGSVPPIYTLTQRYFNQSVRSDVQEVELYMDRNTNGDRRFQTVHSIDAGVSAGGNKLIEILGRTYEVVANPDGTYAFHLNGVADINGILAAAGIDLLHPDYAYFLSVLENDPALNTVYTSDPRTNTVLVDGIRFVIDEVAGLFVSIHGRRIADLNEDVDPLLKEKLTLTVKDNGDGTYTFTNENSNENWARAYTSDATTNRVILENYIEYEVEVADVNGLTRVRLIEVHEGGYVPAQIDQVVEVYGINYVVTKNPPDDYTFFDGIHTYTSTLEVEGTLTVRLGEFLNISKDEYEQDLDEADLAKVRGILYEIIEDAQTGRISLVDRKTTEERTQIISLNGVYYTARFTPANELVFAEFRTGDIIQRTNVGPSGIDDIVIDGITYTVTEDPLTGLITVDGGAGAVSVPVELIEVNSVVYLVTGAPGSYYFEARDSDWSNTEVAGLGLVTLKDGLEYVVSRNAQGEVELVENIVSGESEMRNSVSLNGIVYDVIEDPPGTYQFWKQGAGAADDTGTVCLTPPVCPPESIVTLDGQNYEIRDVSGAITLIGAADIGTLSLKKVLVLGVRSFVLYTDDSGRLVFDDGSIRFLSDIDRTFVRIDDTDYLITEAGDKVTLSPRDAKRSSAVKLYEIGPPSYERRVVIGGFEYTIEYEAVEEILNEGTEFESRKYRPKFTFTNGTTVFENRPAQSVMVPATADHDSFTLSSEMEQFIVDLPEATVRLDEFPIVYTNAVRIHDSISGESVLYTIADRSDNLHTFFANGEAFQSFIDLETRTGPDGQPQTVAHEYVDLRMPDGGMERLTIGYFSIRERFQDGSGVGVEIPIDFLTRAGDPNDPRTQFEIESLRHHRVDIKVVEVARYYEAIQDPTSGRVTVRRDDEISISEQRVQIGADTFNVIVDAEGGVSLVEEHRVSTPISGRFALRVGDDAQGYSYVRQTNGQFAFSDTFHTYLSFIDGNTQKVTLADGQTYNILYDDLTGLVTLTQAHAISTDAGPGKVRVTVLDLDGVEKELTLSYTIMAQGIVELTDVVTARTFTAEARVKVGPKYYLIKENATTGELEFTEEHIAREPMNYIKIKEYTSNADHLVNEFGEALDVDSIFETGDILSEQEFLAQVYDLNYIHNTQSGYNNYFLRNFDAIEFARRYYGVALGQDAGFQLDYFNRTSSVSSYLYGDANLEGNFDMLFNTFDGSNIFDPNYLSPFELAVYQDGSRLFGSGLSGVERVFSPEYNLDFTYLIDMGNEQQYGGGENNYRTEGFIIEDRPFDISEDLATGQILLEEHTTFHLASADETFILGYKLVASDTHEFNIYDSTYHIGRYKEFIKNRRALEAVWTEYTLNDMLDPDGPFVGLDTAIFQWDPLDPHRFSLHGVGYRYFENSLNGSVVIVKEVVTPVPITEIKTIKVDDVIYKIEKDIPTPGMLTLSGKLPTGGDKVVVIDTTVQDPTADFGTPGEPIIYDVRFEPITGVLTLEERGNQSAFVSPAQIPVVASTSVDWIIEELEGPCADCPGLNINKFLTTVSFIEENPPGQFNTHEFVIEDYNADAAPQDFNPFLNTVTILGYEKAPDDPTHFFIFSTHPIDGDDSTRRYFIADDDLSNDIGNKDNIYVARGDIVYIENAAFRILYNDVNGTVSLKQITSEFVSRSGIEMAWAAGSRYYELDRQEGTYTVAIGSGRRFIPDVASQTPPYYPQEFESNPFAQAIILDDGIRYDLVIDPRDPNNVDILPDQVNSFDRPDLKLGNRRDNWTRSSFD